MCKANDIILGKVEELVEIKKMIEELENEAESISDEIKTFMADEEVMLAGSWKVTYRETITRRLDTGALKKILGDALESYYKTVITRPFRIS